ncbi:MAG: PspC domain-containing protein [Chloroflexota bacterium]|jgi:phage shock protein PspC (stress-responsive transcriptional regulator)
MRTQRLTRSLTDRTLGGVCGGLGAYVGVNPWWVRALFVILGVFTAGTGLLLYVALWLILPPQSLADIPAGPQDAARVSRPEIVVLIGAVIIGMGLIVLARNLGVLSAENGDAFLPLAVILFGLVLLAKQLWRAA